MASDLDAVVLLERQIATAPHWSAAEYARILTADPRDLTRRRLIVAYDGDALLGFAVGRVLGSEAELQSVAVADQSRRMGVGRTLCRSVMDWCSAQGASVIDLEVRAGSGGAIRLYEGLGFVQVGRRAGYYRDPVEDAVIMRCGL